MSSVRRFCESCGASLLAGHMYCEACGHPVAALAGAAVEMPPDGDAQIDSTVRPLEHAAPAAGLPATETSLAAPPRPPTEPAPVDEPLPAQRRATPSAGRIRALPSRGSRGVPRGVILLAVGLILVATVVAGRSLFHKDETTVETGQPLPIGTWTGTDVEGNPFYYQFSASGTMGLAVPAHGYWTAGPFEYAQQQGATHVSVSSGGKWKDWAVASADGKDGMMLTLVESASTLRLKRTSDTQYLNWIAKLEKLPQTGQ